MATINMAVFDMAGTTVNEDNVVYKTVQKAINKRGYDVSLEDVLAVGAGKEKRQAIKSVLALHKIEDNGLSEQMYSDFLALLEEAYQTSDIKEGENATELFHKLKEENIYVVLNTGYNRETAEALIEKIGWQKGVDFDLLVTASDVENNRPNPDMIAFAMKHFGITNGNVVIKTGDSVIDIEEGRNAGCKYNIGITTGAQTYNQLAEGKPDFIIDNLMEILPIVQETTTRKQSQPENTNAE